MRFYSFGLLLMLSACTGAPDTSVDGGVDDAGFPVDTCTPLYDAYAELLSDFSGAGGVCESVDDCVSKRDDIDCVDGASFSLCGVAMHVDAAADFDIELASLTGRVCATGDGCALTASCEERELRCVDGRCVHDYVVP